MQVDQIMQKAFVTVEPGELVQAAADKMRKRKVPVLLVLENEHVRGILTEKELREAMSVADVRSPEATGPDDEQRCCYFNSVQVELILGR